ncbi:hypothetical protein [Hydrogenophaga sp.]|uniref:hypothetical protein n=1 Tax=Hydrogenophaga sp. TaxID=1904254 RepID=UPI00351DFE23
MKHATYERDGVHRSGHAQGGIGSAGGRGRARGGRVGSQRRTVTHKEAPIALCQHQALGQQQVVGGHHGGRVQTVLGGTLAHTGARWAGGRQQAVPDAVGKPGCQLLSQRLRCGAREGGRAGQGV